METTMLKLTELIARAPWRGAVTYQDTWPHEYVLSEKDGQQDYVLNRARLYRDRQDFIIQTGDTGKPEDYPVNPAYQG